MLVAFRHVASPCSTYVAIPQFFAVVTSDAAMTVPAHVLGTSASSPQGCVCIPVTLYHAALFAPFQSTLPKLHLLTCYDIYARTVSRGWKLHKVMLTTVS